MRTEELMQQWQEVFKKKNKDYGSSWKKVGKILNILFEGKEASFATEDDFNKLAVLIRILDKVSRYSNLSFVNSDTEVDDETVVDTAADAGTYFFMLASLTSEEESVLETKESVRSRTEK